MVEMAGAASAAAAVRRAPRVGLCVGEVEGARVRGAGTGAGVFAAGIRFAFSATVIGLSDAAPSAEAVVSAVDMVGVSITAEAQLVAEAAALFCQALAG